MKMWHGGAPGRVAGDGLLPPSDTMFQPTNADLTGKPKRGRLARASRRRCTRPPIASSLRFGPSCTHRTLRGQATDCL